MSKKIEKVSIKFKTGAYGAYRSMNNKVWYALAEFVDNALQSYTVNKRAIKKASSNFQFKVLIDINIDEDYIKIWDNAGGIDAVNFKRAFEPANIPLDNTGLSEFGMGMKIASIWLADFYSVRSSALGEMVEREVHFDLKKVMNEEKEELEVSNTILEKDQHFTEIILKGLSENAPKRQGQSISRLKNHLTSIYRKFLRKKEMILVFNGDELKYEAPAILKAPFVDDPDGKTIVWKKDINFKYDNYKVKGFIGLLKEMKSKHCGLSLFRRGRVIQGSHDEKFHPKIICGQSGSPRDKRLFGELELKGFKVSFDKGRFTQVGELETILSLVKKELNAPSLNLLKQGDKYRKPIKPKDKEKEIKNALKDEKKKAHNIEVTEKRNKIIKNLKAEQPKPINKKTKKENTLINIPIPFSWKGKKYLIEIEYVNESGLELYTLYNLEEPLQYKGRINLKHKFFQNYNIFESEDIEPILAILKGLLLSEAISQSQGTKMGGNIRSNLNKLLESKVL